MKKTIKMILADLMAAVIGAGVFPAAYFSGSSASLIPGAIAESATADPAAALKGKTFSILGDSISTFEGYIPEGYLPYYPAGDVDQVEYTWWKIVESKSQMTLLSNASWSGCCVCDTDNNPDNDAFITYADARISDLSANGTAPDIILVFVGTNDFGSDYQLGSLTETSELPDGKKSIRSFSEAYALMLDKIIKAYPHAHVYCCTFYPRHSPYGDTDYPIKNRIGKTLSQYNSIIRNIAGWMGFNVIRLDTVVSLAGIPDYTIDGYLHPNRAGMTLIANRVLQALIANETVY